MRWCSLAPASPLDCLRWMRPTPLSPATRDGIGQGASIVLNKVGNDILGQIGGVTYFTISVNGNGVVTFTDKHGEQSVALRTRATLTIRRR